MSGSILVDVGILRFAGLWPETDVPDSMQLSVEIVSSDVTHMRSRLQNVRTLWSNASLLLDALPLAATRPAFRRQIHYLRGLHPLGCQNLQFSSKSSIFWILDSTWKWRSEYVKIFHRVQVLLAGHFFIPHHNKVWGNMKNSSEVTSKNHRRFFDIFPDYLEKKFRSISSGMKKLCLIFLLGGKAY